jgi:flagellar hook assembly protein FlgD
MMIRTTVILLAALLLPGTALPNGLGKHYSSYEVLTTPPLDSAEAERVRIWLSVEEPRRCLVTIDILDDSNRVVRQLLNRLLSRGYYNFYWNKKDDSGHYVPPGRYLYRLNKCGRKEYGELRAEFKKWELASRIIPPPDKWSSGFEYELLEDSALVSIGVYNRRGKLVDEPVTDSLMSPGRHQFRWQPSKTAPRGLYTVRLTIGDYTREIQIGYQP